MNEWKQCLCWLSENSEQQNDKNEMTCAGGISAVEMYLMLYRNDF